MTNNCECQNSFYLALFDVDNTGGVRPDKSFIKNTCDEKSKKEQDKIIKM